MKRLLLATLVAFIPMLAAQSVVLSWTEPATPTGGTAPTGFIVQRANGTCSATAPFGTLVTITVPATTTYTDNTVVAGQTYCYQVITTGAGGSQSAPSNQEPAVIPVPAPLPPVLAPPGVN